MWRVYWWTITTAFTREQIAHALRQAETGTPVTEVCRAMGITEQTHYRWKKSYGGLGVHEIRWLKLLEEENRRLEPPSTIGRRSLHQKDRRR